MGVVGAENKYNNEIKCIKIYYDHYTVLSCESVVSSVLNGLRREQFRIFLEYNVVEVESSGTVIFPFVFVVL
jgi:hypothetical protein